MNHESSEGLDAAVAPLTVAFYLPQFHPIPENDEWWGAGFTEWVNVRRAAPMFEGHQHPATPIGPYGEYDLREWGVVAWQTQLATSVGIDAFCYYHYWFDGKRLLEAPLDAYLKTSLPMPFMICWANENWSRRWDGKSRQILLGQRYGDRTPADVFESFLPYLLDQRYLRLHGRAVLLVHRAAHLPEPRRYAETWRRLAHERGIGELWLVASETSHELEPSALGFDAIAEFPPVGDSNLRTALKSPPSGLSKDFRGRLLSYEKLSMDYVKREEPTFVRHRGLVPRWDNSARRGPKATIVVGSSPDRYAQWLQEARAHEKAARPEGGLVFVNAWNEWAEGAYLEPDEAYGDAYLRATEPAYVIGSTSLPEGVGKRLSLASVRSLALIAASQVKASVARLAASVQR
jgi:lipopolysaccharide biosynthesis protein